MNVETLKVNQNNTFMEILAAFLPAFLQQLDPHADSIKEVSCAAEYLEIRKMERLLFALCK